MSFLKNMNPFKLPTPEQISKKQIEEAERLALQYEADAEYSYAMATMYRARVERLRGTAQQHEHQAIDLKTGRRVA